MGSHAYSMSTPTRSGDLLQKVQRTEHPALILITVSTLDAIGSQQPGKSKGILEMARVCASNLHQMRQPAERLPGIPASQLARVAPDHAPPSRI